MGTVIGITGGIHSLVTYEYKPQVSLFFGNHLGFRVLGFRDSGLRFRAS